MNAPPPIQTAFHEVSDVLYRALGGGWESMKATADVRAGSATLVKPTAGQ